MNGEQTPRPQTAPFYSTDQDALNCAAMLHQDNIAMANRNAMDLGEIGYIMSHAIGSGKAWEVNYILSLLDGRGIKISHKEYWKNTETPISLYSPSKLKLKQWTIKLVSFLSRFYLRRI